MQGRAQALHSVESTIHELGNIFTQLATMVSQQGELAIRYSYLLKMLKPFNLLLFLTALVSDYLCIYWYALFLIYFIRGKFKNLIIQVLIFCYLSPLTLIFPIWDEEH